MNLVTKATFSSDKATILMIDDDRDFLHLLQMLLQRAGYRVVLAENGKDGLLAIEKESPHLVVLDITMPGMDGFDVLRRIRIQSDIPVLMLTSLAEISSKIRGLSFGADDYMTKPFNVDEFMLRIQAILRRANQTALADEPLAYDDGTLHINYRTLAIKKQGELLSISPTETSILCYLARRAGHFVSTEELLQCVWGKRSEARKQYVRIYIYNIRQLLEDDPENPYYITSSRGRGYRFRPASEKGTTP